MSSLKQPVEPQKRSLSPAGLPRLHAPSTEFEGRYIEWPVGLHRAYAAFTELEEVPKEFENSSSSGILLPVAASLLHRHRMGNWLF